MLAVLTVQCDLLPAALRVLCCAADYARIVKDLATIGDTVDISTSKDAVKFSTSGDIGTANVTVRWAATLTT